MSVQVGEIQEIRRYPVKSFAGESLESCNVETYGLHGDRIFAFYDETLDGWESFITARDIPTMLAYKARLLDEEINVLSPDGRMLKWDDELLWEIQRYTKRKVSMTGYHAPNPENLDLMSVDSASILIITDAALGRLESLWGKGLDRRRFRPNLVVSVDEQVVHDNEWIGRRLFVGEAELQVDMPCERCSVITWDPDTLERDASLLKKVYEEMNLNFGLYASVVKTGPIRVGDKVYIAGTGK